MGLNQAFLRAPFALAIWLWLLIPFARANDTGMRVSRPICAGLSGLGIGVALGIGIGALIWNRSWYRNNGVSGGIWVGKKRRKRGLVSEEENRIMETIERAQLYYEE